MYIPKFAWNVSVDIDNPPENFEEQIRGSFKDFTQGTAEKFMYEDKLAYIDRMRRFINKAPDADDAVKDMMHEYFDYQLDNGGRLPTEEDFMDMGFLETVYEKGDQPLYTRVTGDHHKYDKIMKLMERAIKTVINYEGE
ncbi:MAG: hypothetical protein Q4B26_14130 [Eubacteriales bacterium]|nr:hypothetical protein [Eubacteriales bacterium]